jgi:hypothetical protein
MNHLPLSATGHLSPKTFRARKSQRRRQDITHGQAADSKREY